MGDGSRRNNPCHCGSGKKYKNCCLIGDTQPRMIGSTFRVPHSVWLTGFMLGPDERVRLISGENEIDSCDVKAAEWRQKDNGEISRKSEIAVPGKELFLGPEAAIAGYDFIFGIDTNQLKINGHHYNISCLTCATRQITSEGYEGSIQQIMALDFCDVEYPAEKIGWVLAIKAALQSGVKPHHKVVICTDHDLKQHSSINVQAQPIIADFILPANFRIMYARDRGGSIPNKAVASANKGATAIRRLIEDGADAPPQRVLPALLGQAPLRGFRVWHSDAYKKYFDPRLG